MDKREVGTYYEEAVMAYLQNNNIEIIDRNVRCGRIGEIDLIGIDQGAEYGSTLVFFEVKYRKNSDYGEPMSAVDVRKQRTIRKCAEWYLAFKHIDKFIRFDVVSVCGEEVTWIKDAF